MSQLALITGASTGIGFELGKLFARDGYNLVIVARSAERLEKAASEFRTISGADVRAVAIDLSEPDAPGRIFDQTGAVDVLVNNAGFGASGAFAETDLATDLNMIHLNIAALVHLTKLYLTPMLERRSGRILNVASTAGFQPGPGMAVYYASKAFVLSFSEALAEELKGTGVSATALCPGATVTEFAARAGMNDSRLFRLASSGRADQVAAEGYEAMNRGEVLRITGWINKTFVFGNRVIPRFISRKIAQALNAKS
jgi:short-subunit dehydrogenase